MEIVMPIGISGSGKSTLYNNMFTNYEIVCPDQIRLKLTGNISDQSKNKEVFEMVDTLVDMYIKEDKNFFYDATNVNTKYRKEFVKKVKKHPNVKVVYIYLYADVEESNRRIQKDLEEGKIRSNVSMFVLKRQYDMYMESLKSNWQEEGADSSLVMDENGKISTHVSHLSNVDLSSIKV